MIALASDHGGFELKQYIQNYLQEKGIPCRDYGSFDSGAVDYPDVTEAPCRDILEKKADLGIFICGTGVGISIAANKRRGIRAACCSEAFSARLTREHNDANVLCLGGRVLAPDNAVSVVEAFLAAEFSEGARHIRRIEKIHEIETAEQ